MQRRVFTGLPEPPPPLWWTFGLTAPAQTVSIRPDRAIPLPPNIGPLILGPKITLLKPSPSDFLVPPLPRGTNPKLHKSDTSVLANAAIERDDWETLNLPSARTTANWFGKRFA